MSWIPSKEDIAVMTIWVAIVFVAVVGASLSFSAKYDAAGYRVAGALLMVASATALGLWFRWCCHISARDYVYVCECCEEHYSEYYGYEPSGKHHRADAY